MTRRFCRALAFLGMLAFTLVPVLAPASEETGAPANWYELVMYVQRHDELPDMTPFAALKELTISIGSLEGIERITGLRRLSLEYCGPDLSPLSELPNLEALDLRWYKEPVDLAMLLKLPRLTELSLPEEVFGEVAPVLSMHSLKAMPNLVSLSLSAPLKEDKTDEEPWALLGSLPKLERLKITGLGINQTKAQADAVIRIIAGLPALKELTLADCDLSLNFTPLNALPDMDVLSFQNLYSGPGDWSGVLEVTDWTELCLDVVPEDSLASLLTLPRLEKLTWNYEYYSKVGPYEEEAYADDPYGNRPYSGDPPDLSPLAQMPRLRSLTMSMINPDLPVDLSPLAQMPELRELTLNYYPADFLADIALPHLEKLDIFDDAFMEYGEADAPAGFDTSLLAGMPNLRELRFYCGRNTDLSALAKLTRLERLYLEGWIPRAEDFAALLGMKQLTYIDLYLESHDLENYKDLWEMLSEALPDCEIILSECPC